MIDRGDYIMHPRNPSLAQDYNDPIKEHIMAAENQMRRGWITHPLMVTIRNIVEINYIENKKLTRQFMVGR
jgi:hypothetical protein